PVRPASVAFMARTACSPNCCPSSARRSDAVSAALAVDGIDIPAIDVGALELPRVASAAAAAAAQRTTTTPSVTAFALISPLLSSLTPPIRRDVQNGSECTRYKTHVADVNSHEPDAARGSHRPARRRDVRKRRRGVLGPAAPRCALADVAP